MGVRSCRAPPIPLRLKISIHKLSILIDNTPRAVWLAVDFHEDFVDKEGVLAKAEGHTAEGDSTLIWQNPHTHYLRPLRKPGNCFPTEHGACSCDAGTVGVMTAQSCR